MKVTVEQGALKTALTSLKPVMSKRSFVPVLAGIKVQPNAGWLELIATDLDVTVYTAIPAQVSEPTAACLPFAGLLASLPSTKKDLAAPVELEIVVTPGGPKPSGGNYEDDYELVATNGHVTRMPAFDLADYPALPMFGDAMTASDEIDLDTEAVASVINAASVEDSRPILTGVLFHENNMVATDAYRLFVVEGGFSFAEPTLIPARALRMVLGKKAVPTTMSILRATTEPANGIAPPTLVAFKRADGVTIFTRLIDGQYPNWRALMPEKGSRPHRMMFNPAEVVSVLDDIKRLKPCSTTPIRFHPGSPITVELIESDRINYKRTIAGRCPVFSDGDDTGCDDDGNPFPIGYNPAYLREVLTEGFNYLDSTNRLKPSVTQKVDPAGRVHKRLIMPVRLG